MNKRHWIVLSALVLPLAGLSWVEGCKRPSDDDEDEKKPASAAPAQAPTAPPTVSVKPEPEDAGPPPSDASDDAADASDAKKVGSSDSTGIRACCAALRQNAKIASPQSQGAYLMAAGACDTMAKGGSLQLAQLRGMLLGAGLPGTCK